MTETSLADAHELLTERLREELPPLNAQADNPDPMIYAKFFTPDAGWTWYVSEGSPEGDDFIFFGFAVGFCGEWGSISLKELQDLRGGLGLPVERDLYFTPGPFSEAVPEYHREALAF